MKLLLADDHALFRGGLAHVLKQLADHTEILEASTTREALTLLQEHHDIDLVLLDLGMPDISGFDAMRELSERKNQTPVVIISASENPVDAKKSMKLGARGFIGKHSNAELVLSALRLIISGQTYFPANALQSDIESATNLTERQLDVLRLMDKGFSNKVIASELTISEATVKMHVTAIFRELDVSNRTQAVLKAQKLGVI